ncbi:ABC transporter ATP-binding protein [Alicyclobacillus sp. SO9]|uniref:oligopeptide/dipeptide ABC transporter ATP-binding protein n=1 Tax=Alicyclobacillus sp. SO9 TaxID=2665646 RepID=UPI0018E7F965|nr:ABC transporter ATP-binding protein [Alicyclobacillus sp. SO9]QQE79191.1 ABC transporter ATP-binding protein [Alicyclobacillus sp. SO9]
MIEIKDLQKTYVARGQVDTVVHALRGVSFEIPEGGAISFIGESGCGKTTVGRILAGLEEPTSGSIVWNGKNVYELKRKERKEVFRKIQLIHQDPYQALNPARSIEQTLAAPLRVMAKKNRRDSDWMKSRMRELLELVGLDPETVMYKYPHMLSGGQRQRVVIARALTVEPEMLVADEAVSMIDVSLRLGILKLLRDLRETLGISLLFITHDVAAARYVGTDGQIYVIYKGLVAEHAMTDDIIMKPVHPYTQALLSAVPVLKGIEEPGPDRFIPMKDMEQSESKGCLFAPRCPFAQPLCRDNRPELTGSSHDHACHFPQERHVVAVATK